ncbi:hypothetical protein PQC34_gp082 [Cronobacter phage A24]|uniref:Uncharacterized protein n=1 Tax=Cronobacter phage A24 TaxID=2795745 RepID=A0A7T5QXN3_9CAUD|nr:hypothetical protein PQC34_gp082 [Cronobacter phage A24]QQG33652.1 hypothetical protein [Cronobacter phage A24]
MVLILIYNGEFMKVKDYNEERWERNSESNKERKIAKKRFKEKHNPWASLSNKK